MDGVAVAQSSAKGYAVNVDAILAYSQFFNLNAVGRLGCIPQVTRPRLPTGLASLRVDAQFSELGRPVPFDGILVGYLNQSNPVGLVEHGAIVHNQFNEHRGTFDAFGVRLFDAGCNFLTFGEEFTLCLRHVPGRVRQYAVGN